MSDLASANTDSNLLRPAVFLDRDGVINEVVFRQGKPASPRLIEEFIFAADIESAVKRLKAANFLVFVVTNQPDVARNKMEAIVLEQIAIQLYQRLPIDDLRVCPHDDCDNCTCRKPRPGMLVELAAQWQVDLQQSFMVGDSWKDMEAGKQAGCCTILLARDYNQGTTANFTVESANAAVEVILECSNLGQMAPNGLENSAIRTVLALE
ncbi:HAD family hydrolase [Phormidium tenue FACHB-886]|nr:HAD family hydrolase [Phormidium tenue FACHB-886]